jgi:outer membrane protein
MNFKPIYDSTLVTCSGADRNNLTFSTNLKESLRGVDFVQENGPTRADLKLKLFKDISDAIDPCVSQLSFSRQSRRRPYLAVGILVILCHCLMWSQTAPMSPNLPWHSSQEGSIRDEAKQVASEKFTVNAASTYSLAELIDLAESHNPETRVAWERAHSLADASGIARSELYPTLVAVALSQASRQQAFLNTRFYRQVLQSSDLAFDLNYTIFDFGGRSHRIDQAKARLLAADFNFNDAHRRVIYNIETAYYLLLNAIGQEDAARANLANADAVRQAAESSLKNGLTTLPDVLEARSAVAEAAYNVQAAMGAEDVAHGNLATALGTSPLQPVHVQTMDQISTPEEIEPSLDQAIDRALQQRPDLLKEVADIRFADARVKEAKSAYLPTLRIHAYSDPQSIYGMQQTLPWGHTASLDGQISFRLGWTVFDGGARKHTLAQAEHDMQAARAQAMVTRDQIENGVWTAYSALKTAFRQREAATALLDAATQSYNAAIQSYHYGVRSLLDVTEAQKTLAQARSADVLARTQVLAALTDLSFQTADSIQPASGRSLP